MYHHPLVCLLVLRQIPDNHWIFLFWFSAEVHGVFKHPQSLLWLMGMRVGHNKTLYIHSTHTHTHIQTTYTHTHTTHTTRTHHTHTQSNILLFFGCNGDQTPLALIITKLWQVACSPPFVLCFYQHRISI